MPNHLHHLAFSLQTCLEMVVLYNDYQNPLYLNVSPSKNTLWELDPSPICEGYQLSKSSQPLDSSNLIALLCSARMLLHWRRFILLEPLLDVSHVSPLFLQSLYLTLTQLPPALYPSLCRLVSVLSFPSPQSICVILVQVGFCFKT